MSYKTALLANGPKAGTSLAVSEQTKQIDVPIMVPGCEHSIPTFKTITYKPVSPTDRVWVTDFDAEVVGMWCQKCDVKREQTAREQLNRIRRVLDYWYPEIASTTEENYWYMLDEIVRNDQSWKNGKWDYVDDWDD